MGPRKYRSEKRRAQSEATRRRIVEATVALHAERGIFGTSWRDIAERADVSLATVYNHFPSLDQLVPACGEWIYAHTAPPAPEDAAALFAGVEGLAARVDRLVATLFDFYQRGEPHLEIDFRERELPAVQEWEAYMRATREAFVREALVSLEPDEATVRAVSALLDFPVFKSFRRQDVTRAEAERVLRQMLLRWLAPDRG